MGGFENGRFSGFGKYVWNDGDGGCYEGMFENGLRHGKGKWVCF